MRDSRALQSLLAHWLKPLPRVMRTETIIVLYTAKETTELAPRDATTCLRIAMRNHTEMGHLERRPPLRA